MSSRRKRGKEEKRKRGKEEKRKRGKEEKRKRGKEEKRKRESTVLLASPSESAPEGKHQATSSGYFIELLHQATSSSYFRKGGRTER